MSLGRCLAFMALKCRTLSYDDKKDYAPPLHPLNFARVSFVVTISRRFTCGKTPFGSMHAEFCNPAVWTHWFQFCLNSSSARFEWFFNIIARVLHNGNPSPVKGQQCRNVRHLLKSAPTIILNFKIYANSIWVHADWGRYVYTVYSQFILSLAV